MTFFKKNYQNLFIFLLFALFIFFPFVSKKKENRTKRKKNINPAGGISQGQAPEPPWRRDYL